MKKKYICKYCGQKYNRKCSHTYHEKRCYKNPNRIIVKGHPLSEEAKKKISDIMKQRHKEGKAHNIGESRWNNEPSYPEKWFMEMLKNELNFELNIDYKKEVPFHKFSLDFLFADKKVIEIDGQQHETNKEQQRRDKEKDKLLKEEGYKELRIYWSNICNNTKNYIQIIKDFILDNCSLDEIKLKNKQFIDKLNELKKKKEEEKLKYKEQGKLNKNGNIQPNMISINEYEYRKNLILNTNIDLTKRGWIKKLENLNIGLSIHQIIKTLNHFNINYYKQYDVKASDKENEEYLKLGPHYCEKCNKLIEKKFGSGRFCSKKCANSHIHSKEIKDKISNGVKKTYKNKKHL